MKIFLMIFTGCVATIGFYAGGLLTAVFFLSADPTPVWKPSRDTGGLWTLEPVAVSEADRRLERLPARSAASSPIEARAGAMDGGVEIDPTPELAVDDIAPDTPVDGTMTTSLADDTRGPASEAEPATNLAHAQWCADRYRSYRVDDNSYTSYSGRIRECVSPYSGGTPASLEGETADVGAGPSSRVADNLSARHIQSCFDRYRSYRPEDNTYQPYGGGPRLPCR